VLFDIDERRVLDIFPDVEALGLDLTARATASNPADRQVELVIRDAALGACSDAFRSLYSEAALLVSPVSLVRVSVGLMEEAVGGAIEEQATREGMAARTGRILFARRGHGRPNRHGKFGARKLGRNGTRRLNRWSREAPSLYEAYQCKETFIENWANNRMENWPAWVAAARSLEPIDYRPVIAMVESNFDGLKSYILEAKKTIGVTAYRATVSEIAALRFPGVYSFAGARAAVLSKYGVNALDRAAHSDVPNGAGGA
jgi:hypothetical protein